MYLGELVRLVLVKFTKMGLLFGGRGSDLLFRKGSFYTKYVSEIESDKPGDYTSCMDVLDELGELKLYFYFFNLFLILAGKRKHMLRHSVSHTPLHLEDCVLRRGTQNRALSRNHNSEMRIFNSPITTTLINTR